MGSFYMESTQINYRRDETVKTVDQKLQELSETSAIDTDIAPVFKSTNTYAPGDMVYYRNKLYVFNVEHTGAWAAGDVSATDVTTELSSLNSNLSGKQNATDNNLTTTSKTVVGGINELKSGLTNLTDVVGWGVDGGNVLIPSAGGSKNGVSYTRVYDQLGYVTKYDLSNATTSANTAILPYRLPVKATSADYKVKYFNLPDGAGYMLWDDTTSSSISYGSGIITVPANHEVYVGIFIIDSGTDMSGKYLQVMSTENTSDPMATYYPTRPIIGAAVADMESRIEAVENDLTSYTLTPDTNVTLDRGSCIKAKNTVIVDAVVTFTEDMAKNNSILTGVPAIGNNNIPLHAVMYANGTTSVKYVRVYYNAIYSSEAFTRGDTIHIMGTYTVTN